MNTVTDSATTSATTFDNSATDLPTEKIKIQKRTPTERQLESLERARVAKKKKSIRAEIHKETEPFLLPSPYLMGTILIGLGGLVAYSFLKPVQNSENTQRNLSVPVQMEPIQHPVQTPRILPTKPIVSPKTEEFFNGGMKL